MMILSKETVSNYYKVNPKHIKRKASSRYPGLYSLKYAPIVMYKRIWNPVTMNCRGAVVREDFSPVVMPFTKVFHRGEMGRDFKRDQLVTVVRKVNGFMAACTWVPGIGRVISTTGSTDSSYVNYAEEYLGHITEKDLTITTGSYVSNPTFLFEIVHPEDPHVVPEEVGAYLLAIRQVAWQGNSIWDQRFLDQVARDIKVFRPGWEEKLRFSDVVKQMPLVRHEGFMVHAEGMYDDCLKLKSPYYSTVKAWGRASVQRLETHFLTQSKDDEGSVAEFIRSIKDQFIEADEQTRFKLLREFLDGQYSETA